MICLRVLLVLGILHSVQVQVLLDKKVYAWVGSDVVLKCTVVTGDVKQITWKREENGQNVDFLTYAEDSGVKKLTLFAEQRVDFLGVGLRDGTIKIRNVMLADENVYTCSFTIFPTGTSPNTTSLYVLAKPDIQVEPPPDPVVAKLPYQTVGVCVAEGAKPAANLTWQTGGLKYITSEREIPHDNGTVTTRSQLRMIPGAEIKDRSVTCIISQNNGTSYTQTERNLTLQDIQYPPVYVRVEVRTLDSGAIQFICVEDSSPPATNFTWKRKDTFDSEATTELGNERTFSIERVSNGLYICEVTNSIGTSSGYVFLYLVPGSSACLHGCLWPWVIFVVAFGVYIYFQYKSKWRAGFRKTREEQATKHFED